MVILIFLNNFTNMKLPIQNLKEYLQFDILPEKILEILSSKVGAVEGYTDLSKMYEGIYIGQIGHKEEHPNADKLAIYKVNIGQDDNIQVVAGDKSLSVGDKVAYIKPGHIVPYTYGTSQPVKIKVANMRGISSNGMLCSEKELNVGPSHDKVLVLNTDADVGVLFAEYFNLNDIVIDIENKALTNRGDLFGILGLAREISAAQGTPFTAPKWYTEIPSVVDVDVRLPINVDNRAKNLCPRYTCISMGNLLIEESPVWLKSVLLKSGIRPINNVVDITNYISIETGQPLHAFDYDKLISQDPNSNGIAHITVRTAKEGEKIHTLDGNLVPLNENNLVIADSTNPIAIAGVIGGSDTQIDSNTKNIIIESANFNKFSIRKTSMELGIFTEAVTRFTRGQSPALCLPLLLRTVDLIKELTQGSVTSNIVDVYPEPLKSKNLSLSISKINSHLGTNLSRKEVRDILTNMQYQIVGEDAQYLTVQAPIFRSDILIVEDIYEDIARIYGYGNIPPKLPLRELTAVKGNSKIELKKKIRNILSNSGCNELDTYSFVSKENILDTNQDPNLAYHIKNALSPELEFMRPSLIVSLLDKGRYNIQKNISPFCIYEFNIPHQRGYVDNFQLPKEDWHMSFLFTSKEDIFDGSSFFQVKRYLEKILNSLNIDGITYSLIAESSELDLPIWVKNCIPTFNAYQSALIKHIKDGKENIVGVMGDIDESVKENFKLPQYSGALEVNLEELGKLVNNCKRILNESKFPRITQDISVSILENTKYSDLQETVLKIINTKERIGSVECIDIYQKESGIKNVTLRVSIEHKQKTLTDKDFEKIKEKIEEKTKTFK